MTDLSDRWLTIAQVAELYPFASTDAVREALYRGSLDVPYSQHTPRGRIYIRADHIADFFNRNLRRAGRSSSDIRQEEAAAGAGE